MQICSVTFVSKPICASEEPLFAVVACCELGFVIWQHHQHGWSLKLAFYFANTLLVVGDCQRCFAIGTNTNNGGQWAPAGNTNSGETPTSAKMGNLKKFDNFVNVFIYLHRNIIRHFQSENNFGGRLVKFNKYYLSIFFIIINCNIRRV